MTINCFLRTANQRATFGTNTWGFSSQLQVAVDSCVSSPNDFRPQLPPPAAPRRLPALPPSAETGRRLPSLHGLSADSAASIENACQSSATAGNERRLKRQHSIVSVVEDDDDDDDNNNFDGDERTAKLRGFPKMSAPTNGMPVAAGSPTSPTAVTTPVTSSSFRWAPARPDGSRPQGVVARVLPKPSVVVRQRQRPYLADTGRRCDRPPFYEHLGGYAMDEIKDFNRFSLEQAIDRAQRQQSAPAPATTTTTARCPDQQRRSRRSFEEYGSCDERRRQLPFAAVAANCSDPRTSAATPGKVASYSVDRLSKDKNYGWSRGDRHHARGSLSARRASEFMTSL